MQKQIRSARVFTLGFIGETEVNEGSGDCLALGVGSYGDTVAVVAPSDSPALELLREELESSPMGFVSVIALTGQMITNRKELTDIEEMAGRQVDFALRRIFSVSFHDGDENRVDVRVSRLGVLSARTLARFEKVVLRDFYCVNCRNAGDEDCRRTVAAGDMEEVDVSGRTITIAGCPKCDAIMTRTGGIEVRREMHRGLGERKLVFEPPSHAYCFSCRREVPMIWTKAMRYSDSQPRPSYRGNCASCLAMVGTPWQRTKLLPIKAKTLEKLVEGARKAEDALFERRMAAAEERHRVASEKKTRREEIRFQDAMARLRRQYKVA
ncbi:MAG: hypothetical protein OXE50_03160 [Chloroflexi bacterium]|nr:hypothetical protein [Chloroflexota bacterium]